MGYIKYIQNTQHYEEVLSKAKKVKESLWIGTANIKDLYVGKDPFLGVLSELLKPGVEIRLIHAKEPGPIFREEFDRHPILIDSLGRVLCPRVHFKMMIFDWREAYVGSANLTGAGIGMKGENKRNFEAGILTDDPSILDAATEQFDKVWRGAHCRDCLRRAFCGSPVV